MSAEIAENVPEAIFVCPAAALWLPRALAGSVLAATVFVTGRVDPLATLVGSRAFRTGLVLVGAIVALWILRRGNEVRMSIAVRSKSLAFRLGRADLTLRFDRIQAVRYDAPFGASRSWLPAVVLVERGDRDWRLPAMLEEGPRLIDEIVERSGREDLAAWADALRLRQRMGRSPMRVRVGYTLALAILALGVGYYFH